MSRNHRQQLEHVEHVLIDTVLAHVNFFKSTTRKHRNKAYKTELNNGVKPDYTSLRKVGKSWVVDIKGYKESVRSVSDKWLWGSTWNRHGIIYSKPMEKFVSTAIRKTKCTCNLSQI